MRRWTGPWLVGSSYLAFMAAGLSGGLFSVGWPSIRRTCGVSLYQAGTLFAAETLGYLLFSVCSGSLLARFGIGTILLLSTILKAAGVARVRAGSDMVGSHLRRTGPRVWPWWRGRGLSTHFATHRSTGQVDWLHANCGLGGMLIPALMSAVLERGPSWRLGNALGLEITGPYLIAAAITMLVTPRQPPGVLGPTHGDLSAFLLRVQRDLAPIFGCDILKREDDPPTTQERGGSGDGKRRPAQYPALSLLRQR